MQAIETVDWARACGSKRRYNKRGAKWVIKQLLARGDYNLASYRCPFCRRWHVGHRPGTRPKAAS